MLNTVQFQSGKKVAFHTKHNTGINFLNGHNGNFITFAVLKFFEQSADEVCRRTQRERKKTNLSFVSYFSHSHSHIAIKHHQIYKSFVCNWLLRFAVQFSFRWVFIFLFVSDTQYSLTNTQKTNKLIAFFFLLCSLSWKFHKIAENLLFYLSGSSIKEHFNFNQLAICSKLKFNQFILRSPNFFVRKCVQKWQLPNFSDDEWTKVESEIWELKQKIRFTNKIYWLEKQI